MGGVKGALWIDVPQGNNCKEVDPKFLGQHSYPQTDNSDYAEVDTQNMSGFYNIRKTMLPSNPTPYATTTLVNNMVPNNRSEFSVSLKIQLLLNYLVLYFSAGLLLIN